MTQNFLAWIRERLFKIQRFFLVERSKVEARYAMLLLSAITLILSTLYLSVPYLSGQVKYELGDIVEEDIRVKFDIRYVNEEETKSRQDEAYRDEYIYFDRNYNSFKAVISTITTELEVMYSSKNTANPLESMRTHLAFLNEKRYLFLSSDLREFLNVENQETALRWAKRYATLIFDNYGIMSVPLEKPVQEELSSSGATIRTINGPGGSREVLWESFRFIPKDEIFSSYAYRRLTQLSDKESEAELPKGARTVIMNRLLMLFSENPPVSYNEFITRRKKQAAVKAVSPVMESLNRGEIIARAGDPVDQGILKKINMMNQYQSRTNYKYITGLFLIMALLTRSILFFINRFSAFEANVLSSHIIFQSILSSFVTIAFLVSLMYESVREYFYFALLVPLGTLSSLLNTLFNPRITMIAGIYTTIFLYILSGYNPATLLLSVVSIITGVYSSARMRKRTQFFKGSVITGVVYGIIILAMDLMNGTLGTGTLFRLLVGFLNAYLGLVLMTGILPVYETLFNVATKFRLLELADFDNPLLKRLTAEAPSTYTHSLMLLNLSERAVSAIGGDTLLTKAGCLYHDIGKMRYPEFYAENRHLYDSAELSKRFSPEESADIIRHHVIDGIEMARREHLPEEVVQFIPEHHGTSVVQYFYHQALEQKNKGKRKKEVDKGDFTYPGPKPQSKETAVVMMADSIEAAARSLEIQDRKSFSDMIEVIVEGKIDSGQLDESGLTLGDLKKTKNAFLEVLLSSYHERPRYPSQEKTALLESRSKKVKGKKA